MAGEFVLEGAFDDRAILEGFKRIEQAAAATGAKAGAGMEEALNRYGKRSVTALQQELDRLGSRALKVNVDSSAFEKAQRNIAKVRALLDEVERKKIAIEYDAGSLGRLQAELSRLQQKQTRLSVDSSEFKDVTKRIAGIESQIDAANKKRIAINVDPRSVEALQLRLGELQAKQVKLDVDSTDYLQAAREIQVVEARIDAANQKRISIDVDQKSIRALQTELASLQERQLKLNVNTTEFKQVTQQIAAVEAQIDSANRKRLEINADTRTIDGLRTKLAGLQSELDKTAIGSRRFQDLQRDIKAVDAQIDKATGRMGLFATAARTAGGIIAGIGAGAAIAGFLRGAIQGAIELETITRKLSITLGQQGAAQALGFTKELADRLGLSFKTLANTFGGFTAAATAAGVPLEQQKSLFAAVAKAAQALGLSNEELEGSLLALQQIASKGTVSMEELRGQLGERLPIALSAAAKGLGLTIKQLTALVESGKLGSSEFFPALTKGLEELTASAGGVPTAAQNLAKFQNAWDELQASFGKNLLPTVVAEVKAATEAINEFGVQSRAMELGFTAGFLGVSAQAAQAVGTLDQLTTQYGLTTEQAKALFKVSTLGVGAVYTSTGELIMTTEQYGALLDDLPDRVKAWAASNGNAAQQAAATDAAELARLKEKEAIRQAQLKVQLQQVQASVIGLQYEQAISAAQKARLEGSISLLDAIVARQQAAANLEQAGADVLMARNQYLQGEVKNEAERARLKKEQQVLEAQALAAQITGAGQKFQAERQSLDLKQKMAKLEQEMALIAAQRAVNEANMAYLKAQQAGKTGEELNLAKMGVDLANGQLGIEQQRAGLLGTTQALERDTLNLNQKTEATKLRAQAAGKGIEQSLGTQLGLLDQSLTREGQRASYSQKLVEAQQNNVIAAKKVADAEQAHLNAYKVLDQARRSGDPKAIQSAIALVGAKEDELNKARGVALATERQVGEQKAVVEQMQRSGIAADDVLGAVRGVRQEQGQLNTAAGGLGQRYVDAARQAGGITAEIQGSGKEARILISNVKDVGRISSTAAGQAKTIAQGLQFSARGAGAITKSDFSGQFEDASFGAEAISGSGIDTVVGRAAGQTQDLTYGMSQAAREAGAFYGWLARASGLPNARWAGGPVDAGAQYRVNELGQEAFLANSGRLALINRAANSTWTAPSSGVVIPAGLTSQLQEQGMIGSTVARNVSQARPARSGNGDLAASVARQSLAITQLSAEVKELRQKDWSVNVKLRGDGQGLNYLQQMNRML